MLFRIIVQFLLGYVNIQIEGYFIERFMNICISKKILLWNIKREKSSILYANIGIQDFKKMKSVAKKTKCKVKIMNKKGLPFLFHKYKKRKFFIILLASFLIGLFGLSHFIWNIEIKGETAIPQEEIFKTLEENGLKIGNLKSKTDTNQVIRDIRLKRDDIAWMGISLKGTNAIVEIVDAKKKPDIIKSDEYCNIVADKEGMITKINVQNGTAEKVVGDIVKKGDVLVGGYLEGKYTDPIYVHAIADIQAKVWYTKTEKVLMEQEETIQTENKENKYSIKFSNFQINLYKKLSKFENYDTIWVNKKIKLFNDFYLPIEIEKRTNIEKITQKKTYEREEAIQMAKEKAEKELEDTIPKTETIVNKQSNLIEKDGQIEVKVIYEVLESIGTKEKM